MAEAVVGAAPGGDSGGGDSGGSSDATEGNTGDLVSEGLGGAGQEASAQEEAQAPDSRTSPAGLNEKDAPEEAVEVAPELEEAASPDDAGVDLTEDSVLKIGDQEHTFQEITEALKLVPKARERIAQANKVYEQHSKVLAGFGTSPADTILGIFTSKFGGDRQKGFEATVTLAKEIVAFADRWNKLPPEAREAMTLKQQLQAREAELAEIRQERQAQEQITLENKWATEITGALTTAGLPAAYLPRVAQKLVDANQTGIQLHTAKAVELVKADLKVERQNLLKTLNPDEIPEEIAQKLAQKRIEVAKSKRAIPQRGPDGKFVPEAAKDEPIVYDPTKFMETFARFK